MKFSKGAIVAIIAVSSILLVAVIGAAVFLYMKDTDVLPTDESIEESSEESVSDEVQTTIGSDYFDRIEAEEFELIFEDQVERVTIQREIDYDSVYPAYMQELVEPWEEFQATLLPIIPTVQEEQNYSADVWNYTGYSTSTYMYEQTYMCTLSTEIHYYKFIACLQEDTPEGFVDILVYRRIEVPEAE